MTAAIAKAFVEKELENLRVLQDQTYQSDFDRLVAETSDVLTEYLTNNRCCYNHRTLLQKLPLTNLVSQEKRLSRFLWKLILTLLCGHCPG